VSGEVCVVGSFMMDLVAHAPRRPAPGETLVGSRFAMHLGGKGFNQAVAASRAGATTRMVGRLGGDEFGKAFRAAMAAEGVSDASVLLDEDAGTGVGLPVVEPDGQNSIIIVPRANTGLATDHIHRTGDAIVASDVLLLQLELPVEVAAEAARLARAAGRCVVLNPAPAAPLPSGLLADVDVLVPNEVEVTALAGVPDDPERAAHVLRERWGVSLVVTMGARGVLVLPADGGSHHVAGHEVTAVDTVGAGDTFCGFLGAALAHGSALVDACHRANAAAALAVTRHGSADAAPRAQEVEEFLGRVSVTPGTVGP